MNASADRVEPSVPTQGKLVEQRWLLETDHALIPCPKLVIAHDPYDPRSERIRALRTELLLRRDAEGDDVIALLSPGTGEGRSQLVAELAIAFAQLERPTLLVDADLRRPQQHLLFNADNERGLSTVLQHHEPPVPYAVERLPSLAVLTAGPVPPNPLELLLSERFARIVDQWREAFEFVLIDTPPIQQYSDGLAVANLAGQVLLLSRANRTSYTDTRDLMTRLMATRSRIVGAVISHF